MTNTDTEFYEKIDKRMAEILTPVVIEKYERGEYDYEKDKPKGDKGEVIARTLFEGKGCIFIRASSVKKGENKLFDQMYSYNGKQFTCEVKTDTYPRIGNLAVEFEDRKKPSGISVTTADYFLTVFPNEGEIWNIKTDNLKKLILENNFPIVPGGDDGEARMYLIPREEFRQHFTIYKISQEA